jgi:hypothetical protein
LEVTVKLFEVVGSAKTDVTTLSVGDIARKHKTTGAAINLELMKGIRHEKEHTSDPKTAREIALDHLKEDPKYYTKLEKAIPEH